MTARRPSTVLPGVFAAALLLASTSHAATPPPRELVADVDLKIAADGSVSAYHLHGWLDHGLAATLEKQVSSSGRSPTSASANRRWPGARC